MIPNKEDEKTIIKYNKLAHDFIASSYDDRHIEIYNPTEQKRIKEAIQNAFSYIKTNSARYKVMDFGSGTGNLTSHLIELDADILAADISVSSLELLKKILSIKAWASLIMRVVFKQKKWLNGEGDIHVYLHDHIEWEKIKKVLMQYCEILTDNDYLVCREVDDSPKIYNKWKDRCADMRLMIAVKI